MYLPIFDSSHVPAGINFYTSSVVQNPTSSTIYTSISANMKTIYNKITNNEKSQNYAAYSLYYTGTTDFAAMRITSYYQIGAEQYSFPSENYKGGNSYTGQ